MLILPSLTSAQGWAVSAKNVALQQVAREIHAIQRLLGHSDVKTTMIYLQTVPSVTLKEAKSPLYKKIVSMGQPPMNAVNIAATVTLKGLGAGRSFVVRVLDENGYERNNGSSQVIGPDLKITLPTNSLYTVVMMPPGITSQPQSQTNVVGAKAIFNVAATGTAPLIYQWQFNGMNLTDDGRLTGS